MKYVITGATSFIGLELLSLLRQKGDEIVAVCRPDSCKVENIPSGTKIVLANMYDYGNLHNHIAKADVFINLAWGGTGHAGRNIEDIQKGNIENTIAAFQAAHSMGCKVFVEAGSQAEYGTVTSMITEETACSPFSEYGKAKLGVKDRCFKLAEALGLKYIHLRIFSIFGENDHPWTLVMSSLDKMLKNEPIDLSPCTQDWNFIYVKDAVERIAALCEYAVRTDDFMHEVYNIASRDTRILKEFVEEMKSLTKSNSMLNYGAIKPLNVVSLNPDMTKTEAATGLREYTSFDKVVERIIGTK